MTWKQSLYRNSRNASSLWGMAIGILLAGLILGGIASFIPARFHFESDDTLLDAVIAGSQSNRRPGGVDGWNGEQTSIEFQLVALAHMNFEDGVDGRVDRLADALDDERQSLVRELAASVEQAAPTERLRAMVRSSPPTVYANAALAALYLRDKQVDLAAEHFEIEGNLKTGESEESSVMSRKFAIECYRRAEDVSALNRLSETSGYRELISARDRFALAKGNRDYWRVFWIIPELMARNFQSRGATALAFACGLGWLALAMQMGQVGHPGGTRIGMMLAGVVMGGLSIWLTDLFIVWQELDWNLVDSNETVEGIRFYVLGVGLREETAKLLMLLPLMPWIVQRRSAVEALMVSASVGLGFAIIENQSYFASSLGADSVGRFLTANFIHMSLTGVIGLAVAHACWSTHEIGRAVLTFLVVVLVHGLYDAAIAVPGLKAFSFASIILFILLSYAFFQELRRFRRPRGEMINLTATFVFVLSTVTALTFVYVSWQLGFQAAGQLLRTDIAGLGVLVVMYVREMPDSLAR